MEKGLSGLFSFARCGCADGRGYNPPLYALVAGRCPCRLDGGLYQYGCLCPGTRGRMGRQPIVTTSRRV